MIYTGSAGIETTYYATPSFEIVAGPIGTDYRHYLYAANGPKLVISRTSSGAINVRSLLTDHQGSISSIVANSTGGNVASESFTAYGNRREGGTWSGSPTSSELVAMNGVTREGYTFQTVLGSMGLNHMNGRIQDSITGRFLSADPDGTRSDSTQSYNRYSYVENNPLSFTDPTGFDQNPTSPGAIKVVDDDSLEEIVVTATRIVTESATNSGGGQASGSAGDEKGGRKGSPCPKVPAAPSGVDLNANVQQASAHNTTQAPFIPSPYGAAPNYHGVMSGADWFYNVVNYGGQWDYKTQNPKGTQMYTDFGNFNFGATGRAVGFSPDELLWGAGLAQLRHNLQHGIPVQSISTRFDNPDDIDPILAGIQYHDKNCH
jgi:RHS repeat-associated protein